MRTGLPGHAWARAHGATAIAASDDTTRRRDSGLDMLKAPARGRATISRCAHLAVVEAAAGALGSLPGRAGACQRRRSSVQQGARITGTGEAAGTTRKPVGKDGERDVWRGARSPAAPRRPAPLDVLSTKPLRRLPVIKASDETGTTTASRWRGAQHLGRLCGQTHRLARRREIGRNRLQDAGGLRLMRFSWCLGASAVRARPVTHGARLRRDEDLAGVIDLPPFLEPGRRRRAGPVSQCAAGRPTRGDLGCGRSSDETPYTLCAAARAVRRGRASGANPLGIRVSWFWCSATEALHERTERINRAKPAQ